MGWYDKAAEFWAAHCQLNDKKDQRILVLDAPTFTDLVHQFFQMGFEQMPKWKKCDKPFDAPDNTGINSENVIYKGYYIPWKELSKLPKID